MLPSLDVNWWAVLAAAVLNFVVTGAWYSRALFGRRWMELTGKTAQELERGGLLTIGQALVVTFLMAVVTATILAVVIHWSGVTEWWEGAFVGAFLWAGLMVTSQVVISAFEARPWGLLFLMAGHQLVEFVLMGFVLAVWQ
jgi:hypothetical protein